METVYTVERIMKDAIEVSDSINPLPAKLTWGRPDPMVHANALGLPPAYWASEPSLQKVNMKDIDASSEITWEEAIDDLQVRYLIAGRDSEHFEDHLYWAGDLGNAIARKAELEAEFGGDWVIAARLV